MAYSQSRFLCPGDLCCPWRWDSSAVARIGPRSRLDRLPRAAGRCSCPIASGWDQDFWPLPARWRARASGCFLRPQMGLAARGCDLRRQRPGRFRPAPVRSCPGRERVGVTAASAILYYLWRPTVPGGLLSEAQRTWRCKSRVSGVNVQALDGDRERHRCISQRTGWMARGGPGGSDGAGASDSAPCNPPQPGIAVAPPLGEAQARK